MNEHMEERIGTLGFEWKNEGDGYFSMNAGDLAYVAIPENHPDVDNHYDNFDPDVNGGLTYGMGNVYGWDYKHAYNNGSPLEDIPAALEYFRARETKGE